MNNEDRKNNRIDKKKETRSNEISKMIAEGGLFYTNDNEVDTEETVDNYSSTSPYNKKKEARSKEISRMIAEGGLGAQSYYEDNDTDKNKK